MYLDYEWVRCTSYIWRMFSYMSFSLSIMYNTLVVMALCVVNVNQNKNKLKKTTNALLFIQHKIKLMDFACFSP